MAAITGQPAWRQVADDLRAKVRDGTYPVGSSLPSTQQLTEAYAVSTTVVRAAIRDLQSGGVVVGQPGKGVYVTEVPPPTDGGLGDRVEELADAVKRLDARVAQLEADRSDERD